MPDLHRTHFSKLEELNPWDMAIVDTHFYKWLEENFKFFEMRYTLFKEYLESIGFNKEVDKITDRDLELLSHIFNAYEFDLMKGKNNAIT